MKKLQNSMNNCLNCNNPVKQIEGKRQRKYCSDSCRQVHWQKNKKKKPEFEEGKLYYFINGVFNEYFIEASKEYNAKSIEKEKKNELLWKQTPKSINNNENYDGFKGKSFTQEAYDAGLPVQIGDDVIQKSKIEKQIEAIKAEKLPSHITTSMGKKSWNFDQQKRINELENRKK